VVILDQQGQIVADFPFEHSVEGWKSFREKTARFANLAVAIESSQGAAVDQLLQQKAFYKTENNCGIILALRYYEMAPTPGNASTKSSASQRDRPR
jgi:hypothetical protein